MGFGDRITTRWSQANADYLQAHAKASDVAGGLGTISKILRIMLQSTVLAVGAYLVIHQEASGGIMIASSIMTSRALAPIELAIGHWKNFASARQSWSRLMQLLALLPDAGVSVELPPPSRSLNLEAVSMTPPGDRKLIVRDVSFSLSAGDGLGSAVHRQIHSHER